MTYFSSIPLLTRVLADLRRRVKADERRKKSTKMVFWMPFLLLGGAQIGL
ncbi:hypothetical protein O59_002911 [Cellvibrio sp. BR]|nr:hypothetical protein O59_002911 [Cellvibrio sp. BR]